MMVPTGTLYHIGGEDMILKKLKKSMEIKGELNNRC